MLIDFQNHYSNKNIIILWYVPFMLEVRIRVEMQLYKLISKTYTYIKLADLDGLIFFVSKHLLYLRKPHYPHDHTYYDINL